MHQVLPLPEHLQTVTTITEQLYSLICSVRGDGKASKVWAVIDKNDSSKHWTLAEIEDWAKRHGGEFVGVRYAAEVLN